MNRQDPGLLIAIEGIDGAGKTTQVALLTEFFQSAGLPVTRSKEPTDGPWGRKIRESAATGRLPLDEELEAFIRDRDEHLASVVLPALNRGETVILDRYFYSTIAYQGSRGGNVDEVTHRVSSAAPAPDVVFLIDLPPALSIIRIAEKRGEVPNAFETVQNLEAVRRVFSKLASENSNIFTIDGCHPIETTRQAILRHLLDGELQRRHCAKQWGCADPFNCIYRMANTCAMVRLRKAANLL